MSKTGGMSKTERIRFLAKAFKGLTPGQIVAVIECDPALVTRALGPKHPNVRYYWRTA